MLATGSVRSPSVPSAVGLVVANVVPLAGVVWFGWDLFGVMWLYWAESGVIGAFALARILSTGDTAVWRALPSAAFFAVHYGGFWLGHGVFIAMTFGPTDPASTLDRLLVLALAAAPVGTVVPLAASHGASFAFNYLGGGEWREATVGTEASRPYGRVVLLHVVILAGGFTAEAAGRLAAEARPAT